MEVTFRRRKGDVPTLPEQSDDKKPVQKTLSSLRHGAKKWSYASLVNRQPGNLHRYKLTSTGSIINPRQMQSEEL